MNNLQKKAIRECDAYEVFEIARAEHISGQRTGECYVTPEGELISSWSETNSYSLPPAGSARVSKVDAKIDVMTEFYLLCQDSPEEIFAFEKSELDLEEFITETYHDLKERVEAAWDWVFEEWHGTDWEEILGRCNEGDKERVFINVTPHPITLGDTDGTNPFVVQPESQPVSALVVETPAADPVHCPTDFRGSRELTFVTSKFEATDGGRGIIEGILNEHPQAIILGSIIAAQAYPGVVYGMVSCNGYERVPPDQKRMRRDKFTVF